MDKPLDATDWRILAELQRDGRLSYNRLAQRVNLSSPAVAERVRRLEESGVITGYGARVDAARAGLPLTARSIGGSLGAQIGASVLTSKTSHTTGTPLEAGFTTSFAIAAVLILAGLALSLALPRARTDLTRP